MKFEGIIVKRYSGFYYILSEDKNIWECSLRGRFRLKKQTFFPGDNVVCTKIDKDNKKAVIEEVLPRFSELERPLIANVDQV
ncbi:MAG: ribosome small subunit-dependent GTPase A, partial [Clostridia bacterium]|nr:ribosome small subunit-dependent GTPase A [Clostridia bacterium]